MSGRYLYCQNTSCGEYLGSLGGDSCHHCGWCAGSSATTDLLTCPTCGTEKVVVYEMTAVDANTFDHYCHSVKACDPNAKASCLECDWEGERQELKGYVKEQP